MRALVVVLPHLEMGGAQRVATRMIEHWAGRGHDVTVVTWTVSRSDHFRLPPGVRHIHVPEPPLARWARWIARLVEGPRQPAAGQPKRADGTAAAATGAAAALPGALPLDLGRAAYRILRGLRSMAVVGVVRHRLLGRSAGAYALFVRTEDWSTRYLRRVLEEARPDAVFSLLSKTNVMAIAASVGLPHRIVVSERTDLTQQVIDEPWGMLRELLYPAADVVSANSRDALKKMRAYCADGKLRYLPNPLRLPVAPLEGARADVVLFAGRLVSSKAPDVLVDAFAEFRRTAPHWRLEIAGGGPLGQALVAGVDAVGLSNCVTFRGVVPELAPLLARCRIFALPSRIEGTPNALLEAMAHRAACIVSDASPGPLRLIEDGRTGLVAKADSVEDFARAMDRLARDEPLRRRLGEAAFERVRDLGIDRVAPVWDRVLLPDEDYRASAF